MSTVQAVIFNNKKWTSEKARSWLKSHEYIPLKRVHKTTNFLRYRIKDPSKFKRFTTKKMSNGIELVIGFKK